MSIFIWLAVIVFACYLLMRKFKRVDQNLRSSTAQKEARMLAAALTWKNSQGNRDSTKDQNPPA